MNKTRQIAELKAALATARENIDGLNIEARDAAERRKISDILDEGQAAQRVRAEERAAEAATLKSIRDGLIPVAELRKIVVNHRTEGLPGTFGSEFVDIEVNGRRNEVEQAILDALTKPGPVKIKYTLAEPAEDFGSSWGAASVLNVPSNHKTNDRFAQFNVGDKVNIQTLPNDGGYLVSRNVAIV